MDFIAAKFVSVAVKVTNPNSTVNSTMDLCDLLEFY